MRWPSNIPDPAAITLDGVGESGLQSGVLAGRYELQEVIGTGGSATVWRAYDTRLERVVAVKVLLPHHSSDRSFHRRMEREARHIASMKSPNVVSIYDVGSSPEGPFIVMELVGGSSLRQLIDEAGTLGPDQVISIARDVLSALRRAHAEGLIHRDIKPANILITSEGMAKLTDFGISRSSTQTTEVSPVGSFAGTIAYAAPEQLAGEEATAQSDLYSLGCVLYECLSGRPPFEAEDSTRLAFQQRFADPQPISERIGGLPPRLADGVMRALEKEPHRRYESAAAMRADIGGVGMPTRPSTFRLGPVHSTDQPTAVGHRIPRVARGRHLVRWAVVAALGVVGVAIAVAVLSGLSTHRSGASSLASGARLQPNDSLVSPNGRYRLVMQPTGNLVLEVASSGEPIWSTGLGGHAGAYAVMQQNGNLSVYPKTVRFSGPIFQTYTYAHPGATLEVLDNGSLTVEDPHSGSWLWQSGSGPASLGSTLTVTQGLHPLQYMRSPNGQYELTDDGWTGQLKLVSIRRPRCPIWIEPSVGVPASFSSLLRDGEFVMLAPVDHRSYGVTQTWTSMIAGHPNSQLVLGNDGTLTLRSTDGSVFWRAPTVTSPECAGR